MRKIDNEVAIKNGESFFFLFFLGGGFSERIYLDQVFNLFMYSTDQLDPNRQQLNILSFISNKGSRKKILIAGSLSGEGPAT